MKLSRLASAAVVGFLGLAMLPLGGCSHGVVSQPVAVYEEMTAAGMHTRWQAQVGLAYGENPSKLWRVGETIYVLTDKNQLHSFNANAGTRDWTADLGEALLVYAPVVLGDGAYVGVATNTEILLINRKNGEVMQHAPVDFGPSSTPVVVGDHIFMGGGEFFNAVYAQYQGRPQLDLGAGRPFLLGRLDWSVRSQKDRFLSTPVVISNKNILFASHNGKLWNCEAATGQAVWMNRQVNGHVEAPLVADSRLVYIPTVENKIYAFDIVTGTNIWDTYLDGRLDQGVMLAGNNILVVGSGQGLYSLTTNIGEKKWFTPGVAKLVSRTNEKIFAADQQKNLVIMNLETGAVEKTLRLDEAKIFCRNTIDPMVYVVTSDGRLCALEQAR